MNSKYNTGYMVRAKDTLIRVRSDGKCDLTQTGEDFFERFIKNEHSSSASK
jgi:hypothetical protein